MSHPSTQTPAFRAALVRVAAETRAIVAGADVGARDREVITPLQIRDGLKAIDWPQARLAAELGVYPAFIGKWIAGEVRPTPTNSLRLKKVLGI